MTAEYRHHIEVNPKIGLRSRVRGLVRSLGETFTTPIMSREEVMKGIGIFEDPQTLHIMSRVLRDLSVSSWGLYVDMALNKHRPLDPSVNEASIESRLSTLAENGFANKLEPDNPGAFTLYSPTAKGVRVMKALNSI